jgi:chemotaxis protein methyltransferase CheR
LAAARPGLALVRAELERRCGLRTELVPDAQLAAAVDRAAVAAGHRGLEDFVAALQEETQKDGPLLQHLIRRVTIGETSFFRHPEDLHWLSEVALPRLLDAREAQGDRRVRIWSAGCASGEEAYTLAALALDQIERRGSREAWQVSVLGSDINSDALGLAQKAEYGEWSFRGVDPVDRRRWFAASAEGRTSPIDAIRQPVSLAYLNLRDPIYPAIMTGTSALDVILCRNVFIYFFPELIAQVLERFRDCLSPDGCLLCGPSDLFGVEPPEGLHGDPHAPHRLERRPPSRPVVARLPVPPLAIGRPAASRVGEPGQPVAVSSLSARRATPRSVWADAEPGLGLLQRGRYREAADWARTALMRSELSVPHRHCLALALAAESSPAALAAWRELLYLVPEDPEVHLGLAFTLLRLHRVKDAQRHFRAVLRYLGSLSDEERLPGPDGLKVGWVRAACQSLAKDGYPGRRV